MPEASFGQCWKSTISSLQQERFAFLPHLLAGEASSHGPWDFRSHAYHERAKLSRTTTLEEVGGADLALGDGGRRKHRRSD